MNIISFTALYVEWNNEKRLWAMEEKKNQEWILLLNVYDLWPLRQYHIINAALRAEIRILQKPVVILDTHYTGLQHSGAVVRQSHVLYMLLCC